jgi:hypothetical protein
VSFAVFRRVLDAAHAVHVRVHVGACSSLSHLFDLGVDVSCGDVRPGFVFACVRADEARDVINVAGRAGVDEVDSVVEFEAELFDGLFGSDAAFCVDEFAFAPAFCVGVIGFCGACEVEAAAG